MTSPNNVAFPDPGIVRQQAMRSGPGRPTCEGEGKEDQFRTAIMIEDSRLELRENVRPSQPIQD